MSGRGGIRWPRGVRPGAPGARVTRLELFYDLVFVYAFLNVTALTAADLDAGALLRGLLVLALLWLCWSTFTGLGNAVRADQGVMPLVGFATMAAVIVMALAIPQAFTDRPGGLPGPLVFALGYLVVRALQVAVLGSVVRAELRLGRRLLPAVPVLVSTMLVVAAAVVPQRLVSGEATTNVRIALWTLAIAVEYASGRLPHAAGWNLVSAGHWAERHALIVLIALGESILSLGLGPNLGGGLPITWSVLAGAVLGLAIISALWWSYFDWLALGLEQALRGAPGTDRVALGRDVYTYTHLPIIAGIILFALGLKRVLADVSDIASPILGNQLGGIDAVALYGGPLLYLAGHLGVATRALHQLQWRPALAAVLIAGAAPLAARIPALAALGLLAVITVGVTLSLLWQPPRIRNRVRKEALDEQLAVEAEEAELRRRHR